MAKPAATPPPEYLFHGILPRSIGDILRHGIYPEGDRPVFLSQDRQTAVEVGRRHGKQTILTVAAGEMHSIGREFFRTPTGVWTTRNVPAEFVTLDPKT